MAQINNLLPAGHDRESRVVLWVVGAALGHISRSLIIARQLRSSFGINSHFFGPDLRGNIASVIGNEFSRTYFNCKWWEVKKFADHFENLVKNVAPCLVCYDCSPTPWLVAAPETVVPEVYITNYFLTSIGDEGTVQDVQWETHRAWWEHLRKLYRLPDISSVRQFYEKDLVLLVDPPGFIPCGVELPDNYRIVGPCFWEPDIPLPEELEKFHNILFVSMGSTAADSIPAHLIETIAGQLHPDAVIGVGKVATEYKKIKNYPRLPNSKVLERSVFALTHGGTGTVYQALACGVPVACWPMHINHKILGRRVEKLGFGKYFDPDHDNNILKERALDIAVLEANIRRSAGEIRNNPESAAREIANFIQRL